MRGNHIIPSKNLRVPGANPKGVIGRSPVMIQRRNAALLHRYFWYDKDKKLSYEFIIKKLSEEVFLAQYTIIEILTCNVSMLSELRKTKPSLSHLKKEFPQYTWN